MKENLKDKLRKDIRFQRFMVDFGSLISKRSFSTRSIEREGRAFPNWSLGREECIPRVIKGEKMGILFPKIVYSLSSVAVIILLGINFFMGFHRKKKLHNDDELKN